MSTTLHDYIKEYKNYRYLAGVTAGIAAGVGLSQNFYSMGYGVFLAILYKKISDYAKKKSCDATEFQLLNSIYKQILEEVKKNIKTLELGDVEGIFVYFCHILLNKYLSYDRNLPNYHIEGIFNEESILSALTLNGHGVCRNNAPMLTDVYTSFDIKSKNILCKHFETHKEIILPANEYFTNEDYEKLEGIQKPEEAMKELENIIERITTQLIKEGKLLQDISQFHCINQVTDKEHSYLLDAGMFQFYIDKDKEEKYYSNRHNYFKVVNAKAIKNPYKKTITNKLEISLPLKSPEEMIEELNKRSRIIKENGDIIESMYKEIKPILLDAEKVYKYILQAQ